MIALAQGCAGMALAVSFALLWVRRAAIASVLLTAQSAAVALAAIVADRPVLALPPVLLTGLIWLVRPDTPGPPRNAATGIGAGLVLAVVCHADDIAGAALAIALMAVLFAALRRRWLVALVCLQNGVMLMASTTMPPLLLPVACLVLPLPLAACAMIGRPVVARARWSGWIALLLTAGMLLATLAAALDSIASVFAPLLAFAGLLRAWHSRGQRSPQRHATRLLQLGFSVLAVCAPTPVTAWIAIIAAIGCALSAILPRRCDRMALALLGSGLALLSLAMPPDAPIGDLGRFVCTVLVAGCVPDLAVPLVILLLRQTAAVPMTPEAATLLMVIASVALLGWAVVARGRYLGFAAMAALSIAAGQPDGRFAAVVLLVLLILAQASLPPLAAAELVLLPGVTLVALAVSGHHVWLLVPLGIGLIPPLLQLRRPCGPPGVSSLLPLGLAALFGWFAPASLVAWLHTVAAIGR